jgi:large subunit ribosomal protein L30
MTEKIKVKLVRGLAGKRKEHITAVHSLGLRKRGDERILADDPRTWGNIKKAWYLVGVAYRIDFSGDIPAVERDLSEENDRKILVKDGIYTNGKGVYYFSRVPDLEDFLRKKGYKQYKNWKGEVIDL